MTTNPMHQFEVYKIGPEINLGGVNLSYTNASLFMTISAILILSLLFFGTKKKSLIPSKIQLITEIMKDLKEISTRLKIAKKNIKKDKEKNRGSNAASLGKALKISTELVAPVVVGSTIGFLLDNWFDTKPLLVICFFFMGVAAGILNVFKSAKRMHKNYKN